MAAMRKECPGQSTTVGIDVVLGEDVGLRDGRTVRERSCCRDLLSSLDFAMMGVALAMIRNTSRVNWGLERDCMVAILQLFHELQGA